MLRPVNTALVPSGGVYRYVVPETGAEVSHPYYNQAFERATNYRITNNLPIASNWEDLFDDNVCAHTPCKCENPETVRPPRVMQQARGFLSAMADWAKSGLALTSAEVLAERRAICEGLDGHQRCRYWRRGPLFGRCGKCGCSSGLKSALLSATCPAGFWPR